MLTLWENTFHTYNNKLTAFRRREKQYDKQVVHGNNTVALKFHSFLSSTESQASELVQSQDSKTKSHLLHYPSAGMLCK